MINMRISKRLKTISEFIDKEDKIIDIGCDHALLDIYIKENIKNDVVIASDIHEGALSQAKKNITKHSLDGIIELRLGDGLDVIDDGEVNTIIIAGMGYNNIVKIFTIIAFIITSILGVLLHFAYDFSGRNIIIGLFTPVNESTWEHLKLLFFPAIACMIIGIFIIKPQLNRIPLYINGLFISIITGLLLIIVLFYTLTGITGTNIDWLNIAIYFISAACVYALFWYIQTYCKDSIILNSYNYMLLSITLLFILVLLFFLFTITPPAIGLFKDPDL